MVITMNNLSLCPQTVVQTIAFSRVSMWIQILTRLDGSGVINSQWNFRILNFTIFSRTSQDLREHIATRLVWNRSTSQQRKKPCRRKICWCPDIASIRRVVVFAIQNQSRTPRSSPPQKRSRRNRRESRPIEFSSGGKVKTKMEGGRTRRVRERRG